MERTDIVQFIKAKRLTWFGHIQRRKVGDVIKKVINWKLRERRLKIIPKVRRIDQLYEYIKKLKFSNGREIIRTRLPWNKIMHKAKKYMEEKEKEYVEKFTTTNESV